MVWGSAMARARVSAGRAVAEATLNFISYKDKYRDCMEV